MEILEVLKLSTGMKKEWVWISCGIGEQIRRSFFSVGSGKVLPEGSNETLQVEVSTRGLMMLFLALRFLEVSGNYKIVLTELRNE